MGLSWLIQMMEEDKKEDLVKFLKIVDRRMLQHRNSYPTSKTFLKASIGKRALINIFEKSWEEFKPMLKK